MFRFRFLVSSIYLNGVHRAGGEGGVGEGLGGTQQVADAIEVMLVLLDGFDAHPLSRQQSLIAWGITGWRHELEVSMTATQEEPSPEVTEMHSVPLSVPLSL